MKLSIDIEFSIIAKDKNHFLVELQGWGICGVLKRRTNGFKNINLTVYHKGEITKCGKNEWFVNEHNTWEVC